MTAERWEEVQRLFHEALGLSSAAREALLLDVSPEVRADVEAMLRADTDLPAILKHRASASEPQALAGGYKIGPYRIVRELGRGGMGAVYLARRDDVEKDVALKLVKSGLAAPEVVERFVLERRALARLQHPGVAQLLDAGVADAGPPFGGTPYFAMEYVAGVSITGYADAQALSVRQRVELFLGVCEAVHYAHQRLVIHRDLKPSNVLVTEGVDSAPTVKLLDFGIAKLIDRDASEEGLTRTGFQIMTPEYAAPEQVRGLTITTATDVYALGVLLYELLSGHRPHDLVGLTPSEIERLVCTVDPIRPSALLAPDLPGIARDDLRQRLAGDLDAVVLKALEKDPARRYASAEAFADDLRRYLDGHPVEARAQTGWYRFGKYVRRNRRGVATGAAFIVVLAVLVGVFAARLADERDLARAEAAKAEQVSLFLVDLFGTADPFSEGGMRPDTMTARTLLASGARRIESDLADQPELQAELYFQVGVVYGQLGLYEEAERLLERSLALRRIHLGAQDSLVASTINRLGSAAAAQSHYERAEQLFREALAISRSTHGGDHTSTAYSLDALGRILRNRGQFREADALVTEALGMLRRLHGDDHHDVTATLGHLAFLKVDLGEFEAAAPLYSEVIARTEARYGREHPRTLAQMNNFGAALLSQGRYSEVEPIFRELVARNRESLGAEHPRVVLALMNLGSVLRNLDELEEAEQVFKESLELGEHVLGVEHEHYAGGLAKLGAVIHEQGRAQEAEPHLRRALSLHTELLPRDHWQIARSQGYLGACLLALERLDEAERLITESHRVLEATFGSEHYVTEESAERVAALYATVTSEQDSG